MTHPGITETRRFAVQAGGCTDWPERGEYLVSLQCGTVLQLAHSESTLPGQKFDAHTLQRGCAHSRFEAIMIVMDAPFFLTDAVCCRQL